MKTPEPFGYFNNPALDGWQDCAETDEGARPLYGKDAIDALVTERDELFAVLLRVVGWNQKYPSSRVYSHHSIKKIVSEMDEIYKDATRICDAVEKTKGGAA